MAKFSQTFLQGLLQPSYQEGLFTAARQAAQLPAQLQQQKMQGTLQSGLFQLEQKAMAGTLTPEDYQKAVTAYGQVAQASPELAGEIRSSLSRVGTAVGAQKRATDQNKVKSEVANLRQAALAVQSKKGLDPEVKRQTLAKMKLDFNRIKEANPTVDLSSFEGMFEDVVVEAAQLDRIAKEAADEEAVNNFSNQLFQINNFESLETVTQSLLKANPEYAEDIQRLSQVRQASLENSQKRERARVERQFDITGDVDDIRKETETLPEQASDLTATIERELATAEQLQNQYRNDTGWTNEPARRRAEEAIKKAESLIDRYRLDKVQSDSRELRSIDNQLSEVARRGPEIPSESEIMDTAEAMALQSGKDYDRLSVSQQSKFYDKAREELTSRNKSLYQRDISILERRRSSITGETVEEETETPEVAPIKGMDDYDGMVQQALSRNQDPASIVESLRAIGVPTKRLVALADKYKLPLFD